MEICVIGAGYVGLVTSLSFAHLGHGVTVVEADKNKLAMLEQKQAPFYEPGVANLLETYGGTAIKFSDSIDEAVKKSEVIFIAVGTPSLPSGEPDMSAVVAVAKAIGAGLDSGRRRIVVNKSTVPVGSGNWVEMLVNQGVQNSISVVPARAARTEVPVFSVVSNPEFLREGSALHDTFYPDRIVVGSADQLAIERMRELYRPIIEQSFEPPAGAPRPDYVNSVPFVCTDLASAEMIKYSANAFLALKISFANEMSSICEKVGADIREVALGIGLDHRIGTAFLSAGVGWGGSCFGKDVNALIEVAREYSSPTPLLEATISVNKNQRLAAIKKLQEDLKIIKGRTIGLLGLSFKPNTDDLRDAPSLTIAAQLLKMGAQVRAYDPVAMGSCKRLHADLPIHYCDTVLDLATGTDALILVTEWEEFTQLDWQEIIRVMKWPLLIDGRNCLDERELAEIGMIYRGIGH